MKIEDVIFLLTGVGLLIIVAFSVGESDGKKSVCSQLKEYVLTTDGKCIKVEQDQPKEK